MAEDNRIYEGSCYCGAVRVTVQGPPTASGYCHCRECRKWHSAPINAWSIWPSTNVSIDGPVITSKVSELSRRVSCSQCGGCVANIKPTFDMIVVYPMTLAGGNVQFRFEPAFHIYYTERVMDVSDGLPKFVDMPAPFGGSGKTVADSDKTGWH